MHTFVTRRAYDIVPLGSTGSFSFLHSRRPYSIRHPTSRGAASASRDLELELLGPEPSKEGADSSKFAPILTADALSALGPHRIPQRALYGRILSQNASRFPPQPTSPKVYINTNTPFSGLICGVQGSGKSHSTAVLLESCLMSDGRLGTLPAPASALVFHYDTAAGGGLVQPCEAAYLAIADNERGSGVAPPPVTVLVMPTNLEAMKRVYAGIPGVSVQPLHFSQEDISGQRLLSMMKVDDDTHIPLYMEAVMSVLRSMEANFAYEQFKEELRGLPFNPDQRSMMNLRLSLLDSCLFGGTMRNRVSSHFHPGHLTIVDLSSPFMDARTACGFFDFILGLFVEADPGTSAKLIVLDEAHKYLTETLSGTSSRLTESLLTVIRQQRHLGARVLVSTQEPTVVPTKYVDLCSIVIAHRFSSPDWLRHLSKHIPVADICFGELLSKIVTLSTGQAVMFAPNGLGVQMPAELRAPAGRRLSNKAQKLHKPQTSRKSASPKPGVVAPLGQGYLLVQSRLRVTSDGGQSILAVQDGSNGPLPRRVPSRPPTPAPTISLNPKGSVRTIVASSPAAAPAATVQKTVETRPAAPKSKNGGQVAIQVKENEPQSSKKGKQSEATPKADVKPVVNYLETKLAQGAKRVSIKNVQTNLARDSQLEHAVVEDMVRAAAKIGIVQLQKENDTEWVALAGQLAAKDVPSATA